MRHTKARGLRAWVRWSLGWGLAFVALAAAAAPLPAVKTAAAPAWVTAVPVPSTDSKPNDQAHGGAVRYLLVDDQFRFDGAQRSEYRRVVSQALGPQGVEQIGNLKFDFDPEYQTLTLHHLLVRRGDRVVSHLGRARIKVLQREGGLDELLFDGQLTASVVLDDIREGDVVDYAFSRDGVNPVFGGRHFGALDMQWGVPVLERHARVLWPRGRPLFWRGLRGAKVPLGNTIGDMTVYTVSQRNLPALMVDSDTPNWHDPFPRLQFSEFPDWAAVAAWAQPLYAVPSSPGPLLQAEIQRLRRQGETAEQRLRLALRFVQDEIRYLGFEIGVNSHRPHDPESVLRRRFGDCKDKTLLALALLRGLGIDARAALVHSNWRQGIGPLHPSPGVFNHVLLQARLGDRVLWLDPTRTGQGGDKVDDWVQVDLGLALVVDPDTRGLAPMAGPAARTHTREIQAVLDLRAGRTQPPTLTLTTVARGASAESLRGTLASTGRAKLRKQYEAFYARSYPGLVSAGELEVKDERGANRLTVVERYRIPGYWKLNEQQTSFIGDVEVPDLDEQTRAPSSVTRRAPLAMGSRVDIKVKTEVQLPPGWTFKPEDHEVQSDAFHWKRQIRFERDTLTLQDHLRTQADEVPADQVARHAEQLAQVRRQSSYGLYDTEGAPVAAEAASEASSSPAQPAQPPREADNGPHWVPAVAVTLALVAIAWAWPRLWRWNPTPWPVQRADAPFGLGGWLGWATLALTLGVGMTLYSLWGLAGTFTHAEWVSWGPLEAAGEVGAGLRPYLLFELVAQVLLTGALGLSVALVLRRRSAAVPVVIATLLGAAAITLFGRMAMLFFPLLAEAESSKDAYQAWRAVVVNLLWAAYFWRSDRVRATLVRRHETEAAAPSSPPPAEAALVQAGG
ncbi:MAG: DUF3857 domain-containing protein [Inhella sp.]|uniref:DUF3857 domain-containing protein n=1 Tax=Inhella sp. TaxID=1921806 RepID=UPI0022BE37F3|nr:DUF3857 domain-containing protein [Inhella sp.]MCZ8236208.1 DUF3857 domain-containing protein [Inhella sp.]